MAKGVRPPPGEYKSGSRVPTSGIYEVTHGGSHRLMHHVTIVAGEVFPKCLRCGAVAFRLVQQGDSHSSNLKSGGRLSDPLVPFDGDPEAA